MSVSEVFKSAADLTISLVPDGRHTPRRLGKGGKGGGKSGGKGGGKGGSSSSGGSSGGGGGGGGGGDDDSSGGGGGGGGGDDDSNGGGGGGNDDAAESNEEGNGGAEEANEEGGSSWTDTVSDFVSNAGDYASGAATSVGNFASETASNVGNMVSNAADAAAGAIEEAKTQGSEALENGKEAMKEGGDLIKDVVTTDDGQAVVLISFGLTLLFLSLILCMCYCLGCAACITQFRKKEAKEEGTDDEESATNYQIQPETALPVTTKKNKKKDRKPTTPAPNAATQGSTRTSLLWADDQIAAMESKIANARADNQGSYSPPGLGVAPDLKDEQKGTNETQPTIAEGAAASGEEKQTTSSEDLPAERELTDLDIIPVSKGDEGGSMEDGESLDGEKSPEVDAPTEEELKPKADPAASALEAALDSYYNDSEEEEEEVIAEPSKPAELPKKTRGKKNKKRDEAKVVNDTDSVSSLFTAGEDDLVHFSM